MHLPDDAPFSPSGGHHSNPRQQPSMAVPPSPQAPNPYLNLRPYALHPDDFICPTIEVVWQTHYAVTVGALIGVTHSADAILECSHFVSGAAFQDFSTWQGAVDFYRSQFRAGRCRIEPKQPPNNRGIVPPLTPSPAPAYSAFPVPAPPALDAVPAPPALDAVPAPPALDAVPAPPALDAVPAPPALDAVPAPPALDAVPAPPKPPKPPVYHYVSSTDNTPERPAPPTPAVVVTGPVAQPARRRLVPSTSVRDDPVTPTRAPFYSRAVQPPPSPAMLIAEMAKTIRGSGLGPKFDHDFVTSLIFDDKGPSLKPRRPKPAAADPVNVPDAPKKKGKNSDTLPLYLDGDTGDESEFVDPDEKPKAKKKKPNTSAPAKAPPATKPSKAKAKAKVKASAPALSAQSFEPATSATAHVLSRNASPGPSTINNAVQPRDNTLDAAPAPSNSTTVSRVLTPRPFRFRDYRDIGVNTSPQRGYMRADEHSDSESSGYGTLGFNSQGMAQVYALTDNSTPCQS